MIARVCAVVTPPYWSRSVALLPIHFRKSLTDSVRPRPSDGLSLPPSYESGSFRNSSKDKGQHMKKIELAFSQSSLFPHARASALV